MQRMNENVFAYTYAFKCRMANECKMHNNEHV